MHDVAMLRAIVLNPLAPAYHASGQHTGLVRPGSKSTCSRSQTCDRRNKGGKIGLLNSSVGIEWRIEKISILDMANRLCV